LKNAQKHHKQKGPKNPLPTSFSGYLPDIGRFFLNFGTPWAWRYTYQGALFGLDVLDVRFRNNF
jgi:hypothetical protein